MMNEKAPQCDIVSPELSSGLFTTTSVPKVVTPNPPLHVLSVSIETSPSPRSLGNSEQDAGRFSPRKAWVSLVPVHARKQPFRLLIKTQGKQNYLIV